MDVSIAITRTGIFVLVYSLVLGIPFAIAFGLKDYLFSILGNIWWIIPLFASTMLGTAGPYLYFFIQRKAEEKLLADQKRYQSTLKQASAGMTRIKDLKKLLNLIVYILSRTVNLTHASLYLYNPKSRDYTLEAVRGEKLSKKNYYISRRCALIDYLEKAKLPIVAEEIKQQSQDYNNENLKEVYAQLKEIGAEVAVPILTEKRLLAIGVLGKKNTGSMYTPDDLTVFSILASQVALAIENAQFYEESKQTQEQLFQAEKMATIGTMADGLSHQINNRLHTLGFIAGDALDTINLSKDVQDPSRFQSILAEISKALVKIQENVRQGGEIVQGLLRYTRKGQEGFGEVVFDKLVDEVVEMAQFKIKKEYVAIVKDYPQDLPGIHGNFTQLQEVFFNIIDNAYDAIMQKKHEIADENFSGKIKISTRQTEKFLEVNVLDNGMGVKEDDQTKLFTPFFTTKVSSRKGTGLGLYVIKKIVEDNHQGEVFISSEHKVGTLFIVRLPIGKKG
ncbi:MAG TPA: ATP-binding protein [Candidatus Omnitrophota bacterium]|nr:ATP-binding protein [Candidatus Omnitrophota bacterium]HQL41236.1 ATP-binding protein [Candidatus Omnitrophota bacterium]